MTATASRTTNRRPELLAPAGGPEPFAAALAAGADAIYCGMGSFNARRKATNFTDEAFEQACRAAHLAGSRVYVTVNIVIKQSEMGDALQLIHRCSTLGADAFIIQDWGLFFEVKRTMPGIETHISTQANIHDDRGTIWCREQGADRVTLSRELSIDEIAAIHNAAPDVDLEVFSHGAICFCYSGLCLLSSFAMAGRSANRGMCAQPCRLPYELIDENGRSLSPAGRERALCPRDTNTSQLVRRLYDAGAASLKLEGRMKAPDYVYSIVDVYRHQIDDMLADVSTSKDEDAARQRQLKRCFNRDFTHAYQDGTSGDEMMSYERSNNRGQIVGTVLGSRLANRDVRGLKPDDRRRRAAIARIELFEPVGKGDLLELRHDNEFDQFLTTIAADDAAAGDIIECRVPRSMPEGCRVRVIRSQRAIDAAGAALKRDVLRRRAVDVSVVARLGEPFTVTLTCCDNPALTATATGFTVEAAKTRAVEAADLVEHVGRMGSSPFEAASFDVALDKGCGMGFSAVHKVRAAACKALEEAILAPYEERAKTLEIPVRDKCTRAMPEHYRDEPQICATVTTLEAAEAARAEGATRIYMATDALDAAGLSPADAPEQGIVPVLDEVCRAVDHERVDPVDQCRNHRRRRQYLRARCSRAGRRHGRDSLLSTGAQHALHGRACRARSRCVLALARDHARRDHLAWHLRARSPGHHRFRPSARYDERTLHPPGGQRLYPRLRQLPSARPQAVTQEYRWQGHARPHRHPRPLSPVRCLPHRPHAAGSSAARCRRASSYGGRNAARDG